VLENAFTGLERLGGGYGELQPEVGNTLASTPANTRSVTFAFTCSGTGKASLKVLVKGKEVTSDRGTTPCDKSIFQRSVELPTNSPVGFTADIDGSPAGTFAYAYYIEKKQG
jgi:hypothetical protein